MKTIALKIDWMVRGVLKLENSIDTRKSVLSSKRFFSSKFPTVAWELCIDKIGTGWSCTIKVWLRQIGPNTINDMVNTRYKIYAMKDSKRVDIASSTNKLENQEKLGYTGIDMELISSDTSKA
uniref:Reverse transcriptase domain-containing protein n=1 Tax=Meloidogyne hapla TaxID=6305 RepID=A0A1I8BUH5_MELHA